MIITMTRAEGPSHECGKAKTARTFEEANRHLTHWSHTAPKGGGYDKVDFTIVNEETGDVVYHGHYDLKHWHTECANLFAQVRVHLAGDILEKVTL